MATVISVNQLMTPQIPVPFTVTRGQISTAQQLDREDVETYQVTLTARDSSNTPLFSSIPAIITILDANDNPPMFSQPLWNFTLPENINSVLIMEFNVCYSITVEHELNWLATLLWESSVKGVAY